MKKRLLTVLLIFCMLATMLPVAFAANDLPIPTEYLPKMRGFKIETS